MGKSTLIVVLNILCLMLALRIRTTAKGTGACLGIQESSVLILLLNISLLIIIVILKGTGVFWRIEDSLCKLYYLAYLF